MRTAADRVLDEALELPADARIGLVDLIPGEEVCARIRRKYAP